jgi:hypothetical protein
MRSIHDRCGMASAERRRSGGSEVNTRKGKERNGVSSLHCLAGGPSSFHLHPAPPLAPCGLGAA